MSDAPSPLHERRWPLRVLLASLAAVLVIVGVALEGSAGSGSGSAAPTTTTTARSGSRTTTTLVSPPTTTPAGGLIEPPPVTDPANFGDPARGCGLSTSDDTSTSTHRPTVPTRVVGHCTVLEVGDSLGSDLGWGLAREVPNVHALTLVQRDKSSSGLAATWFYNWPAHVKTYLRQYRPNLLVVLVGGNDEQGIVTKGGSAEFNSAAWRTGYYARIREIDLMATEVHCYVLWVGLPIMAPPTYSAGANAINTLYRRAATSIPGVTFLSSWRLFANAKGTYQDPMLINGVPQTLRASDGIHFSYVGENVFATYVTRAIAQIYHVRLAPLAPATPSR